MRIKSHYNEIPYGFEFGSAKVTRLFSDKNKGWITVEIETPKNKLQIYVTKTGKTRVFSDGNEWLNPSINSKRKLNKKTSYAERNQ